MPICPICEREFIPRSIHPQEKYCSEKHKKSAQNKRNYRKRRNAKRGERFIYFALSSNMVKIGFSDDPARRIRALQTGNPIQIELLGSVPGTAKEERILQNRLKSYWAYGEWFAYVGEVKIIIDHLLNNTTDAQ